MDELRNQTVDEPYTQAVQVGRCYRNTKTGGLYRLERISLETETLAPYATYVCVETYTFEGRYCPAGESFVRPLVLFSGKRADGRWYFVPVDEAPVVGHHPIRDEEKQYSLREFVTVAKEGLDYYYEVGLDVEDDRTFTYTQWMNRFHRWSSW